MRNFKVNRDTDSGHKAGEFVSDLRLARHDIPRLLTDGTLSEIDPAAVKFLAPPPAVNAATGGPAAGAKPVTAVPTAPPAPASKASPK